ncbi:MAG: hypothetical protein ABFS18_07080 [Thermodesulfobacteriota bacterium]
MKKQLTSIALTGAFLLTAAPLSAGQSCCELLEQKCTSCHYKSRICDKVGKKNRRSWKNTTKRMIRYGLKLDKSEVDKITDCLVALEENSEKFCD